MNNQKKSMRELASGTSETQHRVRIAELAGFTAFGVGVCASIAYGGIKTGDAAAAVIGTAGAVSAALVGCKSLLRIGSERKVAGDKLLMYNTRLLMRHGPAAIADFAAPESVANAKSI